MAGDIAAVADGLKGLPHKLATGASHWLHMDKPEVFNRILDGFIKDSVTNRAVICRESYKTPLSKSNLSPGLGPVVDKGEHINKEV